MKPQKKGFFTECQVFDIQNISKRFVNFCNTYTDFFNVSKRNVFSYAKTYLSGLLMKSSRKNIERINEFVEGGNYEGSQHFISESPWDHKFLNSQVASDVNEVLGSPDSALCIDESAFSKKGKKSVGCSRQWNGRLGKVDNCQVGVFATLCDGSYSSIIDNRLYLPKIWTEDNERCEQAHIPYSHQEFKTKVELALEMIESAKFREIQFGWIAADAFYGRDSKFTNTLDDKGFKFVVDIPNNHTVYLEDPHPYLPRRKNKRGPKFKNLHARTEAISVSTIFKNLSKRQWTMITVRNTTKGILRVKAYRKRIFFWDGEEKTARQYWLVILHDPLTNETKWFLSNAKKSITLTKLVQKHAARFWIERTFQDGKTSVGMADYQIRGWSGWHHHMSLVMMALLFMLKERMINLKEIQLLSCQDIVELLDYYLPRKDRKEEEVLNNMVKRHKKRKASIESAYKKQKRKEGLI